VSFAPLPPIFAALAETPPAAYHAAVTQEGPAQLDTPAMRQYKLFKDYSRFYNRNLLMRRAFNATPMPLRKLMGPQIGFTQKHPQAFKKPMNDLFKALPGYQRLPK
jgi:hypothetical protein